MILSQTFQQFSYAFLTRLPSNPFFFITYFLSMSDFICAHISKNCKVSSRFPFFSLYSKTSCEADSNAV